MPATKPAFQFLSLNEDDGVAVITFLETASMIEGDKVESLAKELFELIETKKYKKVILNLYNAGYMSSAMLAQLVRLHRKMQDVQREGSALLPSSTGHGRLQGKPVRSVVRDLPR